MMPILMDKILREEADRACEIARLKRNGVHTARDLVSARMLAELEATGDAMRYVDGKGSDCVEGERHSLRRLPFGPSARCGGRP